MTTPRKRADFIEPTSVGVGSKSDSSFTVDEEKAIVHRTLININAESISVTDTGGANGGYGSKELYEFPLGNIKIVGATFRGTKVDSSGGIGAAAPVKLAVGSAAEASNDTLDSVQANIVPSTNITMASNTGSGNGASTGEPVLDGRSSAAKAFLNVGVADAGISANGAVEFTGQVELHWINLGR